MKRLLIISLSAFLALSACAQQTIKLQQPDLSRGSNVMQAFQDRRSATEFSTTRLSNNHHVGVDSFSVTLEKVYKNWIFVVTNVNSVWVLQRV